MIMRKGKIGFFDSGLGGLTILKEVAKLMPNYGYIYLGDNQNTPYGNRSQTEIFDLTLSGVEWLLENNAEIVILACNTASANALRKIQREVLPIKYPDKRVLGIVIPTIEEIEKYTKSRHIGILATKATIESSVYEIEMKKQNSEIKITSQTGGNLVSLIELNNETEVLMEIKRVTDGLLGKDNLIDTVILGCTHYALVLNEIVQVLPKHIRVIGQGEIVATKLASYLIKHPEIKNKLNNVPLLNFYTTSNDDRVKELMRYFYGGDILVSVVTL